MPAHNQFVRAVAVGPRCAAAQAVDELVLAWSAVFMPHGRRPRLPASEYDDGRGTRREEDKERREEGKEQTKERRKEGRKGGKEKEG